MRPVTLEFKRNIVYSSTPIKLHKVCISVYLLWHQSWFHSLFQSCKGRQAMKKAFVLLSLFVPIVHSLLSPSLDLLLQMNQLNMFQSINFVQQQNSTCYYKNGLINSHILGGLHRVGIGTGFVKLNNFIGNTKKNNWELNGLRNTFQRKQQKFPMLMERWTSSWTQLRPKLLINLVLLQISWDIKGIQSFYYIMATSRKTLKLFHLLLMLDFTSWTPLIWTNYGAYSK